MKHRQFFRVKARLAGIELASFPPRLADFFARAIEDLLIVRVLPFDKITDDIEEAFAFHLCALLVHATPQMALIAWIVDHLGEQDRARGRQGRRANHR